MTVSALPLGRGAGDSRRNWLKLGGALGAGALVLGYLFWQEIAGAYRVWLGSTAFSHCFLVLPVAAYLLWERRTLLQGLAPAPDFRVLVLLPLLSIVWLLAAVLNVLEAQQFIAMTMVQVLLLSVLGWRIYRTLLGPFLYLYLLVPSGEFLVPSLQDWTAKFVVAALGLFHVPTYSDGIVISIPEGDFIIAEACAGLRFLIASLAFASFFAMLVYRSWRRRAAFLALATIVPVLANGIRAWGIVYLAHLTDDVTAVEADHIIYGWGFFSAIILLLIVIGVRFADGGPLRTAPNGPAMNFALRKPILATALATALAASGPTYAAYLDSARAPDIAVAAPPAVSAPWRPVDAASDDWHPFVVSPDREYRDAFADGNAIVQRYVALYAAYGRHNNLVRSQNRVFDDDTWVRTTLGTETVAIDGAAVTVDTALIRAGAQNRLVWSFYAVDGTLTGSAAEAKLRQARAILAGRPGISAFVAVAADTGTVDNSAAERSLRGFVGAMAPLAPYLDDAGRPSEAPAHG